MAWPGSASTARITGRSTRWQPSSNCTSYLQDAISAHQRPKLERYGDTLFVVLLPARYLDEVERVEFGELHVFVGRNFIITIRQAESPDLAAVRHRLEEDSRLLCLGPEAILYAVLDQVVDEYAPVVAGLENDIDEIEDQLFAGDPAVARRIYELFRWKSSNSSGPPNPFPACSPR